jgi:hypothetical protein
MRHLTPSTLTASEQKAIPRVTAITPREHDICSKVLGTGLPPPGFCNPSRRRSSKRRVQFAWRTWQAKAGFDRLYPCHSLEHTVATAAVCRQQRRPTRRRLLTLFRNRTS